MQARAHYPISLHGVGLSLGSAVGLDAWHLDQLARLVQRTGAWIEEGKVSEQGALRMADWIEPLLRRESYLALLQERPSVHERLLRIFGSAKWPARYLLKHPGVIDELAGGTMLDERFDAADFERELERRRNALQGSAEDDDENLLNLLRRAHHAEQFRTLARDVEGVLTVEQVADDLSALADAVLRVTARWCWSRLKQKHREEPAIAIIAYGKLGGKELGYGSDLDIVFVYDDEDERSQEIYAAYGEEDADFDALAAEQAELALEAAAPLPAWLTDPAKFAPGTKMTFAGLSDAQERANIIAYLKTAK